MQRVTATRPKISPLPDQLDAELRDLCAEFEARKASGRPVTRLLARFERVREAYWAAKARLPAQPAAAHCDNF